MDGIHILRFVAAFAFVLSLMWIIGVFVKRMGYGKTINAYRTEKRLRLVEYMALDAKTRLVLVRRDDVEHLILVGHDVSQVIESGIKAEKTTAGKRKGKPHAKS